VNVVMKLRILQKVGIFHQLSKAEKSEGKRPSVDGRILLEWILDKEGGKLRTRSVKTQERVLWWVLVNTVMNLRVP